MEVFACLAGTGVRVPVEADPDETVASLQSKAVCCLRADGDVPQDVWLRLQGSSECLGDDNTLLQHTPLESGAVVEVVLGCRGAARTQAFGSGEGEPFDDEDQALPCGRVVAIEVNLPAPRSADVACGLALTYANGVRLVHGVLFRTTQATGNVHIALDADEYVRSVRGLCSDVLSEIAFVTNKREYGPYTGHRSENSSEFSVDFGEGNELLHLHGRESEQSVTDIGFGYGRPVAVQRAHRTPIHASEACLAERFDDDSAELVHMHSRICGLSVWVGDYFGAGFVSGVGVAYTDGTYLRHQQPDAQSGKLHAVAFDDDEFISGVRTAISSDAMNVASTQLTFTTNKRTIGPFGKISRGGASNFSDTFAGQLLFVFSEPGWPTLPLGFGHGKPSGTAAPRAIAKRDVERAMKHCESQLRQMQDVPRRHSLLDYLAPARYRPAPRNPGAVAHAGCECTVS
eukprot:TRINITY_DN2795_c3_g1_i1.p1 TRINITY_DN2795_c3_g1~~TRINITY_DN2795_c3_g1_i1.p1  ORF type:complete len:458 (+),score=88.45 TRINITY_DN2795_c3_g1_i1:196-1569(+)